MTPSVFPACNLAEACTSSGRRWTEYMLLGQYELAWKESDFSGASFGSSNPFASSHLLIRCLRGFGDAIQFLRYARILSVHRKVTVQAPMRLLPLLQRIKGIDETYALEEPLDTFRHDCEMECSDLPYLFRTTLSTIPPPVTICLPQEFAHRADLSFPHDRCNVGIVWAGGSWNPTRSIPLDLLATCAGIRGVSLVSLQRGPEEAQLQALPAGLIARAETPDSTILDTASVISQLDLVITVDTMIAHLAASMGKPVWTLLPFVADWRWMSGRSDSPWYPSMTLFRQTRPGDWTSVIAQIVHKLSEETSSSTLRSFTTENKQCRF